MVEGRRRVPAQPSVKVHAGGQCKEASSQAREGNTKDSGNLKDGEVAHIHWGVGTGSHEAHS